MPRLLVVLALSIATAASALTFTNRFPASSPYWQLITASDNVVYVVQRAEPKTLYRSDDGGVTFASGRVGVSDTVVVDPTNPDVVYTYEHQSVRRSMDGGRTWTKIIEGLPLDFLPSKIVISTQHPSTLYLAGDCLRTFIHEGGLFKSDDRGDRWSGTPDRGCVHDAAFDALADKVYPLITNYFGVASQTVLVPQHQIVTSARNPQVRYGLGYGFGVGGSVSSSLTVVVSFDGGGTWQRLAMNGLDPQAQPLALALDDDSGRLFLACSKGLYVSPNGGPYWVPVAAAPRGEATSVSIEGSFLYVNSVGGMFRAPLATLQPFMRLGALPNAGTGLLRGLAADPNSGVLYAAGIGVWRSVDAGQSWESISADDVDYYGIAVDAAGDVYVLQDWEVFHYSAGRWESYASGVVFTDPSHLFASPVERGVLFAFDGFYRQPLYKSVDGGHSWQALALEPRVNAVALDPNRGGVLYAGTADGVFGSLDGGASWTRLDAGETTAIAVAPSRSSTLYRITAARLLRSDDNGATWRQLRTPGTGQIAIAVDPLDEDSVWIGTHKELWHSADGGLTWREETGNLPFINGLLIDRDGKRLHVLALGVWDAVLRPERRRPAGK